MDDDIRAAIQADKDARRRLVELSPTIESLAEDVQHAIAMRIATGDFQGALELVAA